MINDAKNVNMNIPSNQPAPPQPAQPQPTPVQPQPAPTQPTTPVVPEAYTTRIHTRHHTKMVFLMMITVVLGLIAIISLVFALKMKGGSFILSTIPSNREEVSEIVTEVEEETPITNPMQIDPGAEVSQLDKLDLENSRKNTLYYFFVLSPPNDLSLST